MFVTNWISTTKIQKISEITNFFRHYFLSRTEVFHITYLLNLTLQRYYIFRDTIKWLYYKYVILIKI